ncbi:unnamed protein product [Ixodes persulcatus]
MKPGRRHRDAENTGGAVRCAENFSPKSPPDAPDGSLRSGHLTRANGLSQTLSRSSIWRMFRSPLAGAGTSEAVTGLGVRSRAVDRRGPLQSGLHAVARRRELAHVGCAPAGIRCASERRDAGPNPGGSAARARGASGHRFRGTLGTSGARKGPRRGSGGGPLRSFVPARRARDGPETDAWSGRRGGCHGPSARGTARYRALGLRGAR